MIDKEIKRINDFVNLNTPQANKGMIRTCIYLIIGFFIFFIGDSFKYHYNFLVSKWMFFLIPAMIIIIWGIYLLRNLGKRPFDFLLFWAICGIYYSVEFFCLGISEGNRTQISPQLMIIAVLLDIPLLVLIPRYRYRLFIRKKAIDTRLINYKILFTLILVISPVFIAILKSSRSQGTIVSVLCFLLGYIESFHISLLTNYFVARKYKQYIILPGKNT